MSQPAIDNLIVQLNSLSSKDRKKVVAGMTFRSYCSIVYRNKVRASRQKNGSQTLLWHGVLVGFKNNSYLSNTQDIWRLDSLVGTRKLSRALKQHPLLDSFFIENLFENVSFQFYGNEDETFLISTKNELTEADFGPLHAVKPVDALKRYGLELVETAKEKGYVRVQAR